MELSEREMRVFASAAWIATILTVLPVVSSGRAEGAAGAASPQTSHANAGPRAVLQPHADKSRIHSGAPTKPKSRRKKPHRLEGSTVAPALDGGHAAANPAVDGAPAAQAPASVAAASPPNQPKGPSDAELATIAKTYCSNNAAAATEARLKSRQNELRELEASVDRKSAELSKLIDETRSWIEKRDKLWVAARDNLVEAYSKMRPEAAAQQLGAMSEEAAGSILMKLNARAASAIMNEMAAERAARLADRTLSRASMASTHAKGGS